jgi:hypothetical protein
MRQVRAGETFADRRLKAEIERLKDSSKIPGGNKFDGLVKSRKLTIFVILAKAGIQ